MNWKKYIPPAILVVIIAPLYYATLAHSIYLEDSAEFVAAAHTLSIPHPSGYPLYILTTKLISLLPFLPTVVERINFVSLFWTVLSVLGLYFCLSKLYNKTIAWSLSLLFAIAPLVWQQATYAEVYSLNTFFLVLLFWLYLRYHDQPTNKRLYLLIFTYGLSLSNHYLPLAIAPLIIWLSLRALKSRHPELVEGSRGSSLRFLALLGMTITKFVSFFLLGLLPYLYIPLRAAMHPAFSWFNGDITKMLSYNIAYGHQISASTLRYIFDNIQTIVQSFGWLGLALALGGAVFMVINKYYLRYLASVGALLFGVIMIIALVGGQSYTTFASQFYKTLHVPLLLLSVLAIGYFLQQIKFFYPLLGLLFILPLINLDETFIRNNRSHYVVLENYSRQLLASLPPEATLFVHDDQLVNDPIIFSLAYQQYVKRLRPDIIIYSLTPVWPPPADFPIADLKATPDKTIGLLEKYLAENSGKFNQLYTSWPRAGSLINNFVYAPDNLYFPATNDNLFAQSLLAKYYYDQAVRLFSQKKFKSGQWFLVQAIQYDPEQFSDYYARVTQLRDTYLKH